MILQKIFTSILFVLCFVQEKSAGPIFKIYIQNIIGAIPNTNNNLRLPAPIVKTSSKSVIGTIPNANNYLRCPSANLQIYIQNIIGTIPNTNNNLRLPAPVSKTTPKSVIGTTPNTNNYLRHPASLFKSISKSIVGIYPNTSNYLRYPTDLQSLQLTNSPTDIPANLLITYQPFTHRSFLPTCSTNNLLMYRPAWYLSCPQKDSYRSRVECNSIV